MPDTLLLNKSPIIKHTYFLGNDRLEGRGTGTSGGNDAAEYIAHLLHEYSLLPIADRMSYFQNIPMHGSTSLKSSKFVLFSANEEKQLRLGEDYLLYKTGAETYIPSPSQLVFVGYGIIAPEYDYNDYQSVDVQDKVVVFLSGEPNSTDNNFFNGEKTTIYSYPDSKQRIALASGARGSIMIPIDQNGKVDWPYWQKEFSFEHVSLAYSISSHMSVLLNPKQAKEIFKDSDHTYKDVLNMHDEGVLFSFNLNAEISFEGMFDERDFIARNVTGLIQGSDSELDDSYIILSAHYDHLGVGIPVKGDSIYNGVLDNAAGVASLLEITHLLSRMENKPKRSILVIFLTGEEKGLIGSKYYTDHPIVPLYKTIANINIDGVSAFDEVRSVVGLGSEYSELEDRLSTYLSSKSMSLSVIPNEFFTESESINRSDQFSFLKAGIPSVLITEGLNYKNTSYTAGIKRMHEWNKYIYHSPFDDLDQPLNFDAVLQHAHIILDFTCLLADHPEAPQWKPGSPFINARLQSIAEKR